MLSASFGRLLFGSVDSLLMEVKKPIASLSRSIPEGPRAGLLPKSNSLCVSASPKLPVQFLGLHKIANARFQVVA
jgi:hypothetical protein